METKDTTTWSRPCETCHNRDGACHSETPDCAPDAIPAFDPRITPETLSRKSAGPSKDPWRDAVRPFAAHFSDMALFLTRLPDAELQFMLESANRAEKTNCDFITYDAAQFIKSTCELEMQTRAFTAAVKLPQQH